MWVLIVVLSMYKSGGVATQEFTSRETCVAAGRAIQADVHGTLGSKLLYQCVRK